MRTIKFRGKNEPMNKWFFGLLVSDEEPVCIGTSDDEQDYMAYPVNPETVGQFTGLYDFNGKEIYEGDIIQSIKRPRIRHRIEYNEKGACFYAVIGKYNYCHVYQEWINEFPKVVIGNMTDNPDLMKGE